MTLLVPIFFPKITPHIFFILPKMTILGSAITNIECTYIIRKNAYKKESAYDVINEILSHKIFHQSSISHMKTEMYYKMLYLHFLIVPKHIQLCAGR